MLRLLADENFNNGIIRGVLRANPDIDIVRVQDVGLRGADDPEVLAWAAAEERVLLTHDTRTMTKYAYDRLHAGEPMPGIFGVKATVAHAVAIDDILLLATCSLPDEWAGQVRYLPLR
jgi:hypothetical protein